MLLHNNSRARHLPLLWIGYVIFYQYHMNKCVVNILFFRYWQSVSAGQIWPVGHSLETLHLIHFCYLNPALLVTPLILTNMTQLHHCLKCQHFMSSYVQTNKSKMCLWLGQHIVHRSLCSLIQICCYLE